ncbi:MAG: glycosyl transferase family protein [Ignavibacteria bacterium]|nr:MAG: glycosyl transferase family protein [Ignavibacteria bacterium]KAF0162425.1 MAG: glycosyl transferase family protein [Ignavibacteria bacterium]
MLNRKKQKRILIVRTDRVGDVCYITPALRELRRTFSDAYVAALTQPHTSNLIKNNPNVDAIIVDDLAKESFWKVVKEIRKHKFTHALLMQPTERAAYQLFFAGIPYRVGVGRILYEVITFMRSVSRNKYIPLRHEADYCMDLARKIGVVTDNLKLEIFLTELEKDEAKIFFDKKGIAETELKAFFHFGSLGSAPHWNEEKYFSLIQKFCDAYSYEKYRVILTAREMSQEFREKISTLNNSRIHDISSEIGDLRDMIKIISQADLFFAPSTGPLHIADALNIKCVGLFCHRNASRAKLHGVLNEQSINLEVTEEYCSKHCSNDKEKCAIQTGLNEEDVLVAFNKLLTIK